MRMPDGRKVLKPYRICGWVVDISGTRDHTSNIFQLSLRLHFGLRLCQWLPWVANTRQKTRRFTERRMAKGRMWICMAKRVTIPNLLGWILLKCIKTSMNFTFCGGNQPFQLPVGGAPVANFPWCWPQKNCGISFVLLVLPEAGLLSHPRVVCVITLSSPESIWRLCLCSVHS